MKHFLHTHLLLFILLVSCSDNGQDDQSHQYFQNFLNQEEPVCPEGHKDSIIPIEYGMPSEEMFAEADSGKIWLGGCEPGEFEHYCKQHKIQF